MRARNGVSVSDGWKPQQQVFRRAKQLRESKLAEVIVVVASGVSECECEHEAV